MDKGMKHVGTISKPGGLRTGIKRVFSMTLKKRGNEGCEGVAGMHTETITIYSYSELSEEAKATAYKAWEPDYAFEADNRRTLEAFCTAFGIEVTEYVYNSYCHSFLWRAKNEGDEEITDNEYIRHCLSLFEPTGFYLDDVILGPAKQPTEGKVFGNVIEECLEAFFSACCEDVKYTQSQEYFADFAENNEFEFYENGICIRHR